jgi:hypothetical protein
VLDEEVLRVLRELRKRAPKKKRIGYMVKRRVFKWHAE